MPLATARTTAPAKSRTKARIAASVGVVLLAMAATPALAQGTQSGYTGPSTVPVMTVRQLLDEGKDDQHVTVRGKLVRHIGGDRYVLADSTGEMQVDIDKRYFPQGQPIDANDTVALTGEFDKETFGTSELDVKQVQVIPAR
jgi:uncharacterized protein (TIGR00156 family)